MAWPETRLELLVEMLLGGTYQDVTSDVYGHDRADIAITRGKSSEAGSVEPSRCTMELNNRDGVYSPRNPRSPHFGLLGRNTPVRVWARGTETYLWIPGGTGQRGRTASAASLDVTGDIDVRIELSLDRIPTLSSLRHPQVQEVVARFNTTGTPGNRSWILLVDRFSQPLLGWSTDGDDYQEQFSNVPLPYVSGQRFALRATLDVDNDASGHTVTFYTAPTLDGPWVPLGDPRTASGITSINAPGDASLEIGEVNTVAFAPGIGRYYGMELYDGIDGTLLASPDFTVQSDFATSFTDAQGNPWQIVGGALVTPFYRRFRGEMIEFPVRWQGGGADVWTEVQAAGYLRRLGQGAAPLKSTLTRRIPSGGEDGQVPLAYWPMEEGDNSTQAYSPLEGVRPLQVRDVNWGSDSSLFGSDALPTIGQNASISGAVAGAQEGGWHVDLAYFLDELPATERTMLRVSLTGSAAVYVQVRVSTAGVRIELYDAEDTRIANALYSDAGALADFTGAWNRLQVFSAVDGSNTYVHAYWRDVITGAASWVQTVFATDPGAVTRVSGNWHSDLAGMAIGHLGAWDVGGTVDAGGGNAAPGISYFNDADDAFEGETAYSRIRRLAGEEFLLLIASGDPDASLPVGPQQIATVLDNVQAAAAVDGGMLIEQRETLGLAYRGRDTFYNPTPGLTLDYTVSGEVMHPFEPVDDDQQLRNDITVQRDGGSSARAVLTEGPLSTLPPPDGAGVYDESVTLNLSTDAQTQPQAHWRLHLGTVDEARYPSVTINLRTAPHLIEPVLSLDVGSTIRISNLPDWLPPGPVDLRVEGYTETLNAFTWEITFNCSPGSPWTVAGVAGETDVVEDFEDAVLAVTITDAGDLPWTRDNTQAHAGTWSLRSGAITDEQTTDAVLALPTDAQQLTFWYMTSTEDSGTGFEGDRMLVLVDGVQVLRAQGVTPWTVHTVPVAGATTVVFRYVKDGSVAFGSDAAWIDDLTVSVLDDAGTAQPNRADTAGSVLAAGVGAADTGLLVLATDGPVWTTDAAEAPFDVRLGGEVTRVTAVSSFARDAFGRTVVDGWGTADSGQAWAVTGGAGAPDFDVTGTVGTISLAANQSLLRFAEIVQTLGDAEQLVSISVDTLPTTGDYLAGLFFRAGTVDSATVLYWCNLALQADGTVGIEVRNVTTPVGARVVTPLTYSAGTTLWLRAKVVRHQVLGRVWVDGTTEPNGWTIDRTITTSTVDTGTVGVTIASTDGASTTPTFSVDDYQTLNPQTFTVTRSLNSIVKSHQLGEEIRLSQPAIVAL